VASSGAGGVPGGGQQGGGSVKLCCASSRLGAWWNYWDILLGCVTVFGCEVDRGLHRCCDFQWSPLGDLVGIGHHLVALPRARDQARAAWFQA
jgi:hypothetical protein